jgi:hypothetical protein
MAKWYSEEMQMFHVANAGDKYFLYHWFYTGWAKDWNPRDLDWGYIGVAPYENVPERYRIESMECATGKRLKKRKVIEMLDKFRSQSKIGFRIIGQNLTRKEALRIEHMLRPDNWTSKVDRRVWNEVAGG